MSRIDAHYPKPDYVVNDSIQAKESHVVTNSIIDSEERVTQKELESVSFFSSLAENDTALEIGAAILGSGAAVFAAKKFGLGNKILSKVFPKIQENGFSYRKFFGKKFNLKLNQENYKPIELADNSLISKRIKNPHPTNLRNELERCNYNHFELGTLLRENPNLSRTVGSLPSSWIKGVKGKVGNPSEIQQRVDSVLSSYAGKFHAVKEGSLPSINTVEEELSNILGTKVSIRDLGSGKIGSAYKISAFNEDFVYKVYFNHPMMGFVNHGGHGNHSELLSAIQAKKSCPDKFAEFYMGKFGQKDDGYILTKFIPETEIATGAAQNSQLRFSDYLQRMFSADPSIDNIRNGITLDYGLVRFSKYSDLSPKAQKIARELLPIIDGKSPEKVAKIAKKYSGKQEFEEVKTFLNFIIENKYMNYPDFFVSKKSHLQALGLDFKPDVRKLFQRNNTLDAFTDHYNLTIKEVKEMRETYKALKKS